MHWQSNSASNESCHGLGSIGSRRHWGWGCSRCSGTQLHSVSWCQLDGQAYRLVAVCCMYKRMQCSSTQRAGQDSASLVVSMLCLSRTYKRVMAEAAMLGSFIRLVDYMLVEALVDRTVGTVEELVAMLEAPRASTDKTHKVCCSQSVTSSSSCYKPCPTLLAVSACTFVPNNCYVQPVSDRCSWCS